MVYRHALNVTVKYDIIILGDDMRVKGICNLSELAARDNVKQADIFRITKASSRQQVSRWFIGNEIPHALYLLRIKKATGWTLDEMIKDDEDDL